MSKTLAGSADIHIRAAKQSDRKIIRQLLAAVNLPTESVETGTTTFYLASRSGNVVGIAGFEFYGKDVLLRSVAVPPQLQKQGIGKRIVDFMLSTARERHINRVVLLTETAETFFKKKGFHVVDRSSIDNDSMRQSSEFTVACPTSAVCMMLHL
jgi:amino-acid N-acetyltransferase